MTYAASTVSYWVGQANDTSTGAHPTGWASGQRWSETAAEWQAMQSSTSASLTAMTTDRDLWLGRANNAWGPTRVWNNSTSWEAYYNDMVSQKTTWESRANTAWGPNRVWSNGSSWEALYNDMVVQRDAWITNYNNMVANRDYWQGQANYYWGPSRVHGSGSTWEQLHNAKTTTSASTGVGQTGAMDGGAWEQIATMVTPRAGQAHISAWAIVERWNDAYTANALALLRLTIDGIGEIVVGPASSVPGGSDDRNSTAMVHWTGGVAANWTVRLQAYGDSSNGNYVRVGGGGQGNMTMTVGNT
jgi:hypothetical protein